MDSRGYSSRIVKANLEASTESPGVVLGRMCISKEIPVTDTAEFFGVSRMTIYKWFTGEWMPRKQQAEKIAEVLKKAGFRV
ncbi:MAG: XRE family transcriptional regulator [Caulobacteraceae bacterium]|nr:XRE family transcriptional regulator [Caulobacteraceae bacterium]